MALGDKIYHLTSGDIRAAGPYGVAAQSDIVALNELLNAAKVEIMQGKITLPLATESGEELATDSGAQIMAIRHFK